MPLEFKLPDIGEGIAEGEIVKWLVKVGDTVNEHQSIVEVMTDKATVEVPAPSAGKITELRAKEGDTVPVGSVLFVMETGAAASAGPKAAQGAQAPAANAPRSSSNASAPQSPGNASRPSNAASTSNAKPPSNARSTGNATPTRSASGANAPQSRPPASPAPSRAPAPASSAKQPAAPMQSSSSGGATIEFKLPDIGEGIAEGEIVKWLVKAGDAVKEHQSIVEVMTDKATVEVPAPAAGTITAIHAKEGEVVPVGKVIFSLATGASAPARTGAAAPSQTREQTATPAREQAPREQTPARAPAAREPVGVGAHAQAASAPAARSASDAARSASDGKILAVPSARRLARDMNIDLAAVRGSGRNGVVRRADVEEFANAVSEAHGADEAAPPVISQPDAQPTSRAAGPSTSGTASRAGAAPPVMSHFAPGEREKRTPFRGVRRKIAEAMVRSKFTAPHFTVVEEVDVTELVKLREQAKAIGAESNVKVTFMPFIMKATALSLAKYPMLNGHLDEATQELVHYQYVNLGIAMDTENGLIVPVIKEVQSKGILEIAAELAELAERTRAGKVKSEELKGSTFSITNAGNIGGTLATPIINFPDVAILGVHRIMKKPGVVETPQGDKIEVRQYMNFSCSVDHRLADGADGARFLVYLKKLLENPGLLAL
jgi:pyruvate dehydrogenase E2 component (dihydrolipoamide acetyltransferase)